MKFTVVICWLVTFSVLLVILFGFYPYIDGTQKMSVPMGLLYTSLSPTLWAAAIGWIIFACATNNGGKNINSFFAYYINIIRLGWSVPMGWPRGLWSRATIRFHFSASKGLKTWGSSPGNVTLYHPGHEVFIHTLHRVGNEHKAVFTWLG